MLGTFTKLVTRKTIQSWLKTYKPEEFEPTLLDIFIDLAVPSVVERLGDATNPDYEEDAALTDSSGFTMEGVGSFGASLITYTELTKTIHSLLPHNYTVADIGKQIIFGELLSTAPLYFTNAEISRITNVNDFVVSRGPGFNLPTTSGRNVIFFNFPVSALPYLDVSSLHISKIINLKNNVNGLCLPKGVNEFEGLADLDEAKTHIYYYLTGEKLQLYYGSSIVSRGIFSLKYVRQPRKAVLDTDTLDIKDKYYPLVLEQIKQYCFEHLTGIPSAQVKVK